MTHQDMNQDCATWGPVVSAALSAIEKKNPEVVKGLAACDPEIYQDNNCYKVEWYPENGANLTIYDDGIWLADFGKESFEGKVTPLHHRAWVRRMVKAGVHPGMALFAVRFFKELKSGR